MSKTFADIAKTIRKRFEGRETDPVAMRTMEAQMQKLMEENEMAKSEKEASETQLHAEARKWGGSIKYAKGGKLTIDKANQKDMALAAQNRGMGLMSYARELDKVSELRCGGKMYKDGGTLSERYMFRDGGDPWEPFTDVENVYTTAEMNMGTEYADYLRGNGLLEGFLNRGDLDLDTFTAEAQGVTGGIRPDPNRVYPNQGVSLPPQGQGVQPQPVQPPQTQVPPTLPPPPQAPQGITSQPSAGTAKPNYQPTKAGIDEMSSRFPSNSRSATGKTVNKDYVTGQNPEYDGKTYSSKAAATAAQRKYDLPEMPEYTTKSGTEAPNVGMGNNKSVTGEGIDPKWGAVASTIPYIADLITAGNTDEVKLDRVDLAELDLSKQRDLSRRNSAIGRLMANKSVRGNANSSGQALSALSSQNAAITESQIQGDLQSYLQEETTNTQITNQEKLTNQQISERENVMNEQNKGVTDSARSQALHGISSTAQGSIKDTNLTAENIRYNATAIEIMNQMSPNYQWGTDPETEAWVLQFVNNQNKA